MIDAELARFLGEGLGIHIGTRDKELQPNGARVTAITDGDADFRNASDGTAKPTEYPVVRRPIGDKPDYFLS